MQCNTIPYIHTSIHTYIHTYIHAFIIAIIKPKPEIRTFSLPKKGPNMDEVYFMENPLKK